MEESQDHSLNRLPLLAEALIPGLINDLDLSPIIRSQLRDFIQHDVQNYLPLDQKLLDVHENNTNEVRHAEHELMAIHAEILSKRKSVPGEKYILKRDIPRRLIEQYNLIPFKSTFEESINRRAIQTGVKINRFGELSMVEYTDPNYSGNLLIRKSQATKKTVNLLNGINDEKCHRHMKIERKVEFSVTPKELIFKNFEVGKSYHAKLKVQNISRSSAVFRLLIPKNKFFTISAGGKMKELAPGLSVFFKVTFRCQNKDDHVENITILIEGGSSIIVPMKAVQEPPSLKTNIVSVLTQQTSHHRLQTSTNLFDCERCHVGDIKRLTIPICNCGPPARFFFMPELSWSYKNLMHVTKSNIILVPPFSMKPAYFSLKNHESLNLELLFSPECEGSHAAKVFVVCDNITIKTIDLIGESIAFRPDVFTFQNLNKVYNVLIQDDIDAHYSLYIGTCYPYGSIRTLFNIESSSIVEMKYHWTMQKANIDGILEIPSENIRLSPECGVFCQLSKITFAISFQGNGLQLGRHAMVYIIHIEDLPLESIPPKFRKENYFTEANGRVSVTLAKIEVWVDVVEPCVTILENYIAIKALPNVESKTAVHLSNFSTLPVNISWAIPIKDILVIQVSPERSTIPAMSSRKFHVHFKTFNMGLYSTILKVFVKDSSTSFDVKMDAFVELFVSKGTYNPLDCGIVRVGENYEGALNVKVATPISTTTEMREYMLAFSTEEDDELIKTSGRLVQEFPSSVKPADSGRIRYKLNTNNEQICYNILDWKMWHEDFFLEIFGDCQLSHASLDPNKYVFEKTLFLGKLETFSLRIRNHKLMPTKFEMKTAFGPDSKMCTLMYSPVMGVLPPNSDQEITVTINPKTPGLIQELYIRCYVEGLIHPLVGQIIGAVKDVEVTFSWPTNDGALFTAVWPEEEWNTNKQFPSEVSRKSDSAELTEVSSVTSSARLEYDIMHYVDSSASSIPYEKWPIIGGRYYGVTFTDEDLKKEFEKEWTCETLKDKFRRMNKEDVDTSIEILSNRALCFQIRAFQEVIKFIEITNMSPIRSMYKTKAGFFRTVKHPRQLEPFTEAELLFHHGRHSDGVSAEFTKRMWMNSIRHNVGLGIKTYKRKGYINGCDTVGVKICVFGLAWGTYFDTVAIEISNLPPFHVPIIVTVVENPVYFTFAPYEINPVLRFSSTLPERNKRKQLFLKNNTFLPLSINWTTFVIPQSDHGTANLCLPNEIHPTIGVFFDLQPKFESDFCKIHLTRFLGKQDSYMYRINPHVVRLPPHSKVPLEVTINTTRCWYDVQHMEFVLHGCAVGVVYVDDKIRVPCSHDQKYANEDVACYRPEGFEIDQIYLKLETKVEVNNIRIINSSLKDCTFKVKTTDIFSNTHKMYTEKRKYIVKNCGDGKALISLCVSKPFTISSVSSKNMELPLGKEFTLDCREAVEVEVTLVLTADSVFQICENGCTYLQNKGPLQRNLICRQRDYSEHVFVLYLEILKPLIQISQAELDFGTVTLHTSKTLKLSILSYNGDEPFTVKYKVKSEEDVFQVSHLTGVFKANENFPIAVTFSPRECTRYHLTIAFVTTTPGYIVPFTAVGTGKIDQMCDV